MAEDKSQKTEEATPRRKEKLAEEGNIPKSADIGAAAVLTASTAAFALLGGSALRDVTGFSRRVLTLHESPLAAIGALMRVLTGVVFPIVGVAMVAAVAAGVAQTKGRVNLNLLAIKWERLDPLPRLKTLLPSKESALEIFKQLVKVVAIGVVVWEVLDGSLPAIVDLPASAPLVGAQTIATAATKVALRGGAAFVLVAALDFWLAHRKFNEDNKMSKQELKEEHKESEGDPHIKAKRRRRARELAERRAVQDVSKATVLICNPTHIAVALRYVPGEDAAPMTVAKSVDDVALKMRAEARRLGIPIVENRPFARALYRDAEPGQPIPIEHYGAAAEVIAHVLRLGGTQ